MKKTAICIFLLVFLLLSLEKRDVAVKTQLEGKLGHRKYLALTVEERGK